MARRFKNTLGPCLGFHGCEKTFAEKVLAHKAPLKPSSNDYDWLGPGIYFWVDSPERAADWALEKKKKNELRETGVIGALIHPGLCLNLTDFGVREELKAAYNYYVAASKAAGVALAENKVEQNGVFLRRNLDCAVIKIVHELREVAGLPPYDTVYGVFEEGKPLFSGAGFREKTHVQLAVRNLECITGYFRVKD